MSWFIIASTCTKLFDLGYFSWFVQIITYGAFFVLNFCQKIKISYQNLKTLRNKDFWNSLTSYMLDRKKIFQNLYFLIILNSYMKFVFLTKTEWAKCHLCDIFENLTKIFQIRQFRVSLCNYKAWPFLVSKAA